VNRPHFHTGDVVAAKHLVLSHHYSGRWPSNVQMVGTWHADGGLFGDSGEAVAACVFSIPPTRWSLPVLELIRLVRSPDLSYPLSALVSETIVWVKRKRLADLVVSFADATHEHHGGIYQACSWQYHGQRDRQMDGVIIDGRFIPGRTCNGLFGTRSPRLLAEKGIAATPHYDDGKHLYWLATTRRGLRSAKQLSLESNEYPKPAAQVSDGETPGFQPGGAGSIPARRSITEAGAA
jgi:hypothetical protein